MIPNELQLLHKALHHKKDLSIIFRLICHCHYMNTVVITDYHTSISHSRFTNNSANNKDGAIKLESSDVQQNRIAAIYIILHRMEEQFYLH